jgi:hypothetical protein
MAVDAPLTRVLIAAVPVGALLVGAFALHFRTRSAATVLQFAGAVALQVVVLAHLFEALGGLPAMGWGHPESPGHYLDLAGAVLGLTLFPLGYLWHALRSRPTRPKVG